MEGLDEKFPGKHFHFHLFFSLKEDIDIIFLNIFPISVNGSTFLKLQVVVDLKSFRK